MSNSTIAEFRVRLYGAGGGSLGGTFEEAARRLSQEPRLYFEPDGSFTWSAEWQIGGVIYDAAGVLQFADLECRCPCGPWRRITELLCGSKRDVTVYRVAERDLHDLQTFERLVWSTG